MIFVSQRHFNPLQMELNFDYMDLPMLETLYGQEEKRLNQLLLAGASWQSLSKERELVTKLAMTIHQRRYPLQHFNLADFKYHKKEPSRITELT